MTFESRFFQLQIIPSKGTFGSAGVCLRKLHHAQKQCHKNPFPDQRIAPCVDRFCLIGGAESRFAEIALQLFASSRE
jgi:hypothetical protein